ncbi:NHL repeat-containing protein [Ardenticatena maritima]|uniref:PPM-type phosphatase domain-containing protein n=3 Tax=Ardenticatena maritima TaxID=872965 RepID=A0A0N8GS91_9CHLR|nr:hypothetical protein [Ardenticatena maritima]KPL88642.1 hypothetical protein SE16_07875 [Ardenticatena maritima]
MSRIFDLETVELSIIEGDRRSTPPEMGRLDIDEETTLFVLVELSAPVELWDDVSALLVQTAVQGFSLAKGGETRALQKAAEDANRALVYENEDLPPEDRMWAGLNMALVKGDTLYLAQSGPALTYVARGAKTTHFPKTTDPDRVNDADRETLRPLGEQRRVQVRFARFHLQPGDVFVLSASHLPSLIEHETVREILQQTDAYDIADDIADMVGENDYSALIVQVQPRTEPTPSTSTRTPTPRQHTPAPEPTPATTVVEEPTPAATRQTTTHAHRAATAMPKPRPRPRPNLDDNADAPPTRDHAPLLPRPTHGLLERLLAQVDTWGRRTIHLADVARTEAFATERVARLFYLFGAFLLMLLALILHALEWLLALYASLVPPLWQRLVPILDAAALALLDGMGWLWYQITSTARNVLPGVKPAPPRQRRSTTQPPDHQGRHFYPIASVVVPILLIMAAVLLFWRSGAVNSQAWQEILTAADTQIALAEQLDLAGDREGAQQAILQARVALDEAADMRPDAKEVALLEARLAQIEGRVLRIVHVEPQALATFGASVVPGELVVRGSAVYVLDRAEGRIWWFDATQPPTEPLDRLSPVLAPNGTTVRQPLRLMTWMPTGGTRTTEALLALGGAELYEYLPSGLVRFVPSYIPAEAEIVSLGHYQGNLYLLDSTARQVWKYVPDNVGTYTTPPTEWVQPDAQAELTAPVDFAIDGDIYFLEADGGVVKMTAGQVRPFTLEPVSPPIEAPVALFTDELAPDRPMFYLYIATQDRVLVFDKQGALFAQYTNAADWGAITDVAADETSGLIYVLTTRGVYAFPLRAP